MFILFHLMVTVVQIAVEKCEGPPKEGSVIQVKLQPRLKRWIEMGSGFTDKAKLIQQKCTPT